ncbi:MAG: rod shape-determining protein MreD [Marinobacterium sp.]|nr:rod shape-determining protein MreD [Marinobacterium sp.]
MAKQVVPGGRLVILASFLCSFILTQLPLPRVMDWARPEWVAMTLIFWILVLPHRVGMGTAFVVGLVLDLVRGSVLGLSALSLVTIAYATHLSYRRIMMYPLWQQGVLVLVLIGINQLLFHWMQMAVGMTGNNLLFLLPSLVSAILWPWFFIVLNGVRQLFRIQ